MHLPEIFRDFWQKKGGVIRADSGFHLPVADRIGNVGSGLLICALEPAQVSFSPPYCAGHSAFVCNCLSGVCRYGGHVEEHTARLCHIPAAGHSPPGSPDLAELCVQPHPRHVLRHLRLCGAAYDQQTGVYGGDTAALLGRAEAVAHPPFPAAGKCPGVCPSSWALPAGFSKRGSLCSTGARR